MSAASGQEVDRLLHHSLKDNGIPPCPAVLQKIRAEMRRDDPDLRRVAHTIGADVALAAGLIKTANSPYFGTRRRATSVMDALMLLGLDIASRAVACIALEQLFPNPRGIERFWDASAHIAQLSGWLARERRWPGLGAEDAYTFGLFRDAGIAVLLQRFPDYVNVLRRANLASECAFTAVENEVLPTNHTTVGSMLTQSWWLPEQISAAVRDHHEMTSAAQTDGLSALAQLAEFLLQSVTGKSSTREWEKLGPTCLGCLGIEEGEVDRLIQGARAVIGGQR